MYNMGIIIADISIVVATVWIIKRYLDCFLIKGADNFQNKIIWIIFVVFEVLIEFEIKKASIWNTVINILLVLSISITGYKKGRNKFLIVILLYTIWALIEMFVFYCLNSINLNKSNATLCGSVISKILMIILVNFISVM